MGTLSVSDARSNVEVGRTLYIASYGDGSNGTLTLTDSGAVNVNSDISMGIANTSGSAAVNIGADTTDPSDAARPGVLAAAEIGFWEDSARLNFNHTCDAYIFDTPLVSGNNGASFVHHYAGDTILTGNSADFSGDTIVHDGQLTVDGDLSLSSDSIPDFELGSPGASAVATGISDRIDIIGDLALNGKLNLSQSNELQSDANEVSTAEFHTAFSFRGNRRTCGSQADAIRAIRKCTGPYVPSRRPILWGRPRRLLPSSQCEPVSPLATSIPKNSCLRCVRGEHSCLSLR